MMAAITVHGFRFEQPLPPPPPPPYGWYLLAAAVGYWLWKRRRAS